MQAKTILVHLDDSAAAPLRVTVSARLAVERGARLIGAYLVPNLVLTPSVAAVMPDELVAQRLREGDATQRAAEKRFRDASAHATAEWRAPAGDPFAAMLAHGRCADLVVVGQPDLDDGHAWFAGEMLSTSLMGLGRPLLVVPYIGAMETLGRRVLVAFDGSREAARAIGDAMEFLQRAEEVRVVIGQPDDPKAPGNARLGERIGTWLADHGVRAIVERDAPPPADVGDALISRAADFSSDLIVMGGYGHSRLREMVLGGTTRSVLRAMTVPVLMSH
jgi:nucleotide-binding universal stress UspA family protein